jgi:hypothetical protein
LKAVGRSLLDDLTEMFFDDINSPWVCNCDHPWNVHVQETMEKELRPLDDFQDQFLVDELNNVQRTDLRSEALILT